MKKIILLMIGLLLFGANLYAAGDLQVNGLVSVGGSPDTRYKETVSGTDSRGVIIDVNLSQDGIIAGNGVQGANLVSTLSGNVPGGYSTGIALISQMSSSANFASSAFGANFTTGLMSNVSGSTTVDETASGVFHTVLNSGQRTYNVTKGYGFHLTLQDLSYTGNGAVNYSDFNFVKIDNPYKPPENTSAWSVSIDNLSGVWIDKQTRGTNNYGVVLAGNGSGADIVFGPNQEASIYSAAETSGNMAPVGLWAKDSLGNSTQISPHDPVTGEWIFYSKNIKTGRTVRVNMEKLVKAVEKLTGEQFMIETMIEE